MAHKLMPMAADMRGEWQHDLHHGVGKFTGLNYGYTRSFKLAKFHGPSTRAFHDGSTYEGNRKVTNRNVWANWFTATGPNMRDDGKVEKVLLW